MSYKKIEEVQYITINFTYNEQLVTIKTPPYKKLAEIKKKAIKKLLILNNENNLANTELHCFYLGRDLTEYENEALSNLFNNREKVLLKLMQPKNHLSILSNIVNKKNQSISGKDSNTIDFINTPSPKKKKLNFSTLSKNNSILVQV